MRSSGIRARGHGGNVSRFENVEPCRSRSAAGRIDIDNDRHRRGENLADDVARGINQTAGRANLDQNSLRMLLSGLVDAALDVFVGDRIDGAIDYYAQDVRTSCRSRTKDRNEKCEGPDWESANHWFCGDALLNFDSSCCLSCNAAVLFGSRRRASATAWFAASSLFSLRFN